MDRGYRAFLSLSVGLLCGLAPGLTTLRAQEPVPSVEATPATATARLPVRKPDDAPGSARRAVVNIDREGRLTLNQEPAVLSREELAMRLQRLHQEQGEGFAVLIRSARELPPATVTGVMDKLHSLGIDNVSFVTAGPRPAGPTGPLAGAKPPAEPVASAPAPPRERIKAAMMNARQHEEAGGGGTTARIEQMAPGERKTFEDNLSLWRQMPPEERIALRKQANERNREETLKAIRESGLQLDPDQQEIFSLRYLQERRKLERQIQEQANAERARRLPQILQELKREFAGDKPATVPAPMPGPSPTVSVSAPPKPAPTPAVN